MLTYLLAHGIVKIIKERGGDGSPSMVIKMRTTKDVENLRTALNYNAEGYRLLTQAGSDEIKADQVSMMRNKKLAGVFFKMFVEYVQKVENLEQAAKDLGKKYGIECGYTMNQIINEMALNGYNLQK